jgi:signal transduction histidine kinase
VSLSVIVAVAASALAVYVASRPLISLSVVLVSSLFMGGAISGMHYIGMAAMRFPGIITWRWSLVVASIAIAVSASFIALLFAFRLRRTRGVFRWPRLWASMLMGLAISGMHYTGMAAARFSQADVPLEIGGFSLHTRGMAGAVIAGTVLILALALASAVLDERARLFAREQQARREAEAANRLKDEFLATLSHELRTPLNVIVGRAQMLRMVANEPDKVEQAAETITRNGQALRRLVEDLLDVSRVTVGGLQLEWQPVDLPALLDAAVAGIQPGAEAKGVRIVVKAPPHVPRVMGDPTRLQQVIWNLVTNAVKFTPPPGQVRADIRYDDPNVILTVSDTGQGIDPAFLPHVFDMFRQGEQVRRAHAYGGLGIGLSIVKRLVELHGGTVTAASAGLGHGATFTVVLPSRPVAPMRVQPLKEQRQAI